jgi:hydroxypyruvate reductase
VRGDGTGGRNAETALRCAIEMDAHARSDHRASPSMRMLALSAGTDGIDGNSPAAGAAACELTLARARDRGLDAQAFLDRSDAYTFFNKLGDAIVTGPTGTNVRDLRIMLAS